ncbi:MAG: hypothetical protein IIA44_09375 [Acidobacteria bacterium]|nr:hypothetical protein [Acidobacteriota bacterium]
MGVSTFTQPDFTGQDETALKTNYDNAAAVMKRIGVAFAPHEQATPDMTVRLDAGFVFDGATLTEVAAQNTGTITAPSTNPRIDRVVIDRATGAVSVVTGTEDPSPSPPAIGAGKVPIAQVSLVVSQTEIVNADLTDERAIDVMGLAALAFLAAVDTAEITDDAVTLDKLAHGTANKHLGFDGSGVPAELDAGGFPAGTRMLFQQTAAPTGWTKEVAAAFNDVALRIVTGTVGGAGADAFATVFGTGKVTGGHTLLTAEMPSHNHFVSLSTSNVQSGSGRKGPGSAIISSGSTGGGGSHDHTLAIDLAYKDVIVAQKD